MLKRNSKIMIIGLILALILLIVPASAAPAHMNFATTGLPSSSLVNVSWSGFNNGGQPQNGWSNLVNV
jgi:hypothetical protein